MLITRTSPVSGITRTLDIPCTPEQYIEWEHGQLIQVAMPGLSPDQREFILSGISPDEWDAAFGDEEE